jgi:hypothetical protein
MAAGESTHFVDFAPRAFVTISAATTAMVTMTARRAMRGF